MQSPLFPIFLKLNGRSCVLVGGGAIAEQKLQSLIEAGAQVIVVSPKVSIAIQRYADEDRVRLTRRAFEPSDLGGAFMVVTATGDQSVDEVVFREAEVRGILCNAVDDPPRCHFFYPSVVRRGDLQIAISTNGKSPALAQRLRRELESTFDSTYAPWLDWLGKVRNLYFKSRMDRQVRVRALHRIASRSVYERFRDSRHFSSPEVDRG